MTALRGVWPVIRDLAYSAGFCAGCVALVWLVNR